MGIKQQKKCKSPSPEARWTVGDPEMFLTSLSTQYLWFAALITHQNCLGSLKKSMYHWQANPKTHGKLADQEKSQTILKMKTSWKAHVSYFKIYYKSVIKAAHTVIWIVMTMNGIEVRVKSKLIYLWSTNFWQECQDNLFNHLPFQHIVLK